MTLDGQQLIKLFPSCFNGNNRRVLQQIVLPNGQLFLPLLLLLLCLYRGCAGSTGGLKVIRILLLFLQGSHELKRLVHP